MPTFHALNAEQVAALRSRRRGLIDLTEYVDFLRELDPGEGGEVALQSGESTRTIKRRLTSAAIQLQKSIRYQRSRDGVLRFEVR